MASAGRSKRRSVRQASSRKRSIYTEPDTDEDLDAADDGDYEFQQLPLRNATASRKRPIYTEPDTDEDFDVADFDHPRYEELPVRNPGSSRKRSKPQTRSTTSSKAQHKTKTRSSHRKRKAHILGASRKAKSRGETQNIQFTGLSDHNIPPWASLPIHVLREIFVYALSSRNDQTWSKSDRVNWLMRAARTCRAFAEPALEAFYQSPIMTTLVQPHLLIDLLETPKATRYLDYNVKIRTLHLDVQLLAYTATNRGHADLGRLVAQLPQLKHLKIRHPRDIPPFRPPPLQKWSYPPSLFQSMTEHGTKLRTWRWTCEMVAEQEPESLYEAMLRAHLSPPFQTVRHLEICGFNAVDSAQSAAPIQEGAVTPAGLCSAIGALTNLQDLTFITCEVVVDKFLSKLSTPLRRLELTNCLELTSDMLLEYFGQHGSSLRTLELHHNPALKLSFLTGLGSLCPQLETLKMDLRYFSERINSNDAEPLYNELLGDDERPAWPSTLQTLDLTHLQRMSQQAAQTFFTSLLEDAQHLSDLRTLVLHAHINIPWRDRAGFRDYWIGRLVRVFSRPHKDPLPYLGSLRQFRQWKQSASVFIAQPSARVAVHVSIPDRPSPDVVADTKKSGSNSAPRRSQRTADHVVNYASASTSPSPAPDFEQSDSNSGEDDKSQDESFVQGQCHVVDIRIDNQRPRENQFTEGDFLDSEISGDEDWHEGAENEVDERYAW